MVCKDQRDDQQSLMVRYQAEALINYWYNLTLLWGEQTDAQKQSNGTPI